MLRRSARRILQGASAIAALAAAGSSPSPSPNTDTTASLTPSVNTPPPPPMHLLNTTNSTLSFTAAGDDEWEDGDRIILSTDQGFVKTETYVAQDLDDLHTVLLACALTVAPLLGVFFSVLGIRYVWKKFQEDTQNDDCNDMLARADTSNPSTRQSLSAEQVKASESQFSVLPIEEVDETSSNGPPSVSGVGVTTLGIGTATQSGTLPSVLPISQSTASSQSSNGSIITLMMKNNTLIVEKQEPAIVITRSIPSESLTAAPAVQPAAPQEKPKLPTSNTGLTQSDTSISSIDSTGHNPGYQYGNQIGYDTGPLGYPSYTGYVIPIAPDRTIPSAPPPWPSADYASLVASLPMSTTPQTSFDEDAVLPPEEKRRSAVSSQRKRGHIRTGSCGPGVSETEEDRDAEANVVAAAARAHKRSSLPLLQPLTLLVSDERPMRSPVLDKLRFEDSLSAMERLPPTLSPPSTGTTPNPTGPMPKSPPPRSPLAAAPIPEEDASHNPCD